MTGTCSKCSPCTGGTCSECSRKQKAADQRKAYYAKNAEKIKDRELRRYYDNREKRLAQVSAWQQRNPDIVRKNNRKAYTENRSERLEQAKAHRQENKPYYKAYLRRWTKLNPEMCKAYSHTRRARETDAGPVLPTALSHVFQATCCAYCDIPFEPKGTRSRQVEHILPLARGGTNHKSNFAAACQFCNFSKHDKILYYEWLPAGVVRDSTFTPEEVEAYRVEEVARQRAALATEAAESDSQQLQQAAK